ncbi:MAG TPA: serine dehydratase beta chain, partial [Terriglobales bacterium]
MKTSIFEIFKIGVGPSSSHTVGPMRAARRFAVDLKERGWIDDPHNCHPAAIVRHSATYPENAGPSTRDDKPEDQADGKTLLRPAPLPQDLGGLERLRSASLRMTPSKVARVKVELFGSLALTGHGHATNRAVLLGLSGEQPETIDPATIEEKVTTIRERRELRLLGDFAIPFHEDDDLLFLKTQTLPGHSNGMRFTALDETGAEWYSA